MSSNLFFFLSKSSPSACLSIFSSKLYSLHSKLSFEIGVSLFKSIVSIHHDACLISQTISLVFKSCSIFEFSSSLK